ncbi:MAG: serine/threonine protein kinase [Myxococcaceae bacterium]|jgi:serine/threonine protein kinase|nr:serine/threonine protein kinase [Myxococcaceae bacterium]
MLGLDVEAKLAEGSAVEVFLARSGSDRVVVQVSRPELADDMELYARFLDATRRTRSLKHPGLVTIEHVHCAADGRFVVISEPVEGETASDFVRRHGPLSSERAMLWGTSLCEAIQFLHDHGLVHGCLSPDHVFPEQNGTAVRLLDTALMLFRDVRSLPVPKSRVLVEPQYLAPERVAGKRATSASDIYGLGVLLFELLTGQPPFVDDREGVTRQMHVVAPIPRMPPHLAAWDDVFDRALAKDPADRFGSMVAFRQALLELDARVTRAESVSPIVRGAPIPEGTQPGVVPRGDVEQVGSWIVQRTLGEGGMGRVVEAVHATLNRRAAIKILHPQLTNRPDQVQRFIQEAQAISRLDHPHIVKVFDLVTAPGQVAFVMEHLEGESLKALARTRPLELRRAVRLMIQAAEALVAAHRIGVIHRDIKPDNLFVVTGPTETLKVLDFGVARVRTPQNEVSRLTQVGQVVGTPLWMAPEQVLGRDVDERADLYALATVLYTLLARRFPFEGAAMGDVVMQRLAGEARPIGEATFLGERIPVMLQRLLATCLARDVGKRPASAQVLVDALTAVERSFDVPLDEDDPTPSGRWSLFRRR